MSYHVSEREQANCRWSHHRQPSPSFWNPSRAVVRRHWNSRRRKTRPEQVCRETTDEILFRVALPNLSLLTQAALKARHVLGQVSDIILGKIGFKKYEIQQMHFDIAKIGVRNFMSSPRYATRSRRKVSRNMTNLYGQNAAPCPIPLR
ncbi:hypothetical protein AVEN_100801-1 [Araneus ventricosus]|uniref:Uncharacterized protein n=1 Tax=Araneus ventricosus TaxID=182803 RepID=A0A4Y2AXV3_ARAVE|nr:hypothetical protein AVEN_100801-1 [Araneus ventricosus]